MRYKQMGKWGVKLSVVGLGSWYTLGTSVEQEKSRQIIRTAYEGGVNFFDTANVYGKVWGEGGGEVEQLLGETLAEYPRSSVVILTKVNGKMGPGPNDRGLSRKHIFEQCHASLKRLDTDYIDIYLCHRPQPDVPLEEIVLTMDQLVRQGKVLYWGVSEWAPWRVVKAQAVAREMGAAPIAVTEPRYNLLYRFCEHDLFPATAEDGMGHVVFSPLAQGMLTGKYPPGEAAPPGSRAADEHDGKYMRKLYFNEDNKRRCQELVKLAGEMGVTAAQLAIAWTSGHPRVSSAITGATRPEQVEQNLRAGEIDIPEDVRLKLDELFPLRYDAYIPEGRIFDLAEHPYEQGEQT